MVIMQAVYQETGGHDVATSHIGLQLRDIAEAPDSIRIFAAWQFGNHDIVVFTVQSIEEPDFALLYWPGNGETWVHLVEGPAFFLLEGRKKICRGETVVIVANSGLKCENPCGSFAVLS